MKYTTEILAALVLVASVLGWLYKKQGSEFKEFKRYTSVMLGDGIDFDSIIKSLISECRTRGAYAIFLMRDGFMLKGGNLEVSILEQSLPARAFLRLQEQMLTYNEPIDSTLRKVVSPPAVFLPIAKTVHYSCYESQKCNDNSCACFGIKPCLCWLLRRKEKYNKCLNCSAFTPIGVFLIQPVSGTGSDMIPVIRFINDHAAIIATAFEQKDIHARLCSELNYRTYYDPVYEGVMNRPGLLRVLQQAYSDNTQLSISTILIDKFDALNNELGYYAATKLFAEVVKLVSSFVEQSAVVARYADRDITLVFIEKKASVFGICDVIRKDVANHSFDQGRKISISMGIAHRESAKDPDSLLSAVARALNNAQSITNTIVCVKDDTDNNKKTKKTI